jgi:serpin B
MTLPTCQDVAPLLELYAAGECEPAESARVESHLGACPACTRSVAQLRDVVGLLDLEFRMPDRLADLGERLAEVEQERQRPRRSRQRVLLRVHRAALALAALLLVTLGLSNPHEFPSPQSSRTVIVPGPESFFPGPESLPAREGMKAPPSDHALSEPKVRAVEALALGLWRELRQESGNVAFAPALLHEALSDLAVGARGQTATEMATLLGPVDARRRTAALRGHAAVWVAEPCRFRSPFLAVWSGPGRTADTFDPARPALAQHSVMNWFDENAPGRRSPWRGRLLTSNTRLLLTTALGWRVLLPAEPAPALSFRRDGAAPVDTPALRWSGDGAWSRDKETTLYELPIPNSALVLVFVVPDNLEARRRFEQTWSPAWLAQALRTAKRGPLTVHLPRLAVQSDLGLRKPLEALGLKQPFAPGADFSGIAPTVTFYPLAEVAQHVVLSWQPGEPLVTTADPQERGVVDRPFFFFVRDRTTGLVLLMGRLASGKGVGSRE